MDRVPRAARQTVAEALIYIVDHCTSRNDAESWARLLTFAYKTFSLPPGDGNGNLANIVKRNLSQGYATPVDCTKRPAKKPQKSRLRASVERKLNAEDVSGAVRVLASEDAVAPATADVAETLKAKHPADHDDADYPAAPCSDDPTAEPVTKEEIAIAIAWFPNGSSGGVDGLKPQHLKDLVHSTIGKIAVRLKKSLALLVTGMLGEKRHRRFALSCTVHR